jgi:hypothetical protein
MVVTNFRHQDDASFIRIVCACQRADVDRVHPARERSLRALNRTVDYRSQSMGIKAAGRGFAASHCGKK